MWNERVLASFKAGICIKKLGRNADRLCPISPLSPATFGCLRAVCFYLPCFIHLLLYKTTLTHPNSIHEEIKSRLHSGNVCYHSVENISSSRLLPKNIRHIIRDTNVSSRSGMGGMDWIDTAQDRDRWRALKSAVMNLRVP